MADIGTDEAVREWKTYSPIDPIAERFRLLADLVQELARIAGVEPGDSLYTTLERLREVQNTGKSPE